MAASESMGLVKGVSLLLCAVLIFIIDISVSACFPLLFMFQSFGNASGNQPIRESQEQFQQVGHDEPA